MSYGSTNFKTSNKFFFFLVLHIVYFFKFIENKRISSRNIIRLRTYSLFLSQMMCLLQYQ